MKKTIYKNFDYTQCNEFAAFLSDMAAQGWHFKEWSLGLVFEKGEPQQVEYAVEIFIHGKEEDLRPGSQTEEFADYCEAAGWEFVDAKRKFCIFKKIREDAVDIVTPEERIENIKNAEVSRINSRGLVHIWIIIHTLTQAGTHITTWAFNGMEHIVVLTLFVSFIFSLYETMRVKRWAKRQQQGLLEGRELIPLKMGKVLRIVVGSLVAVSFVGYCILKKSYIGLLVFVAITVCLVLLDIFVKKYRPSRDSHTLIAAGVFLGTIAIFAVAFTVISESDLAKMIYQNSIDRSIFGTREVGYYEYSNSQIIEYRKYCSDVEWLMDKVWEKETEFISDTPNGIYVLEAEEIKTLADWRYMIRNPECIVVVENTDGIPWNEVKEIIEEVGIR